MRYLTSDIVFTANGSPIPEGVLVVNDGGEILDVLHSREGLDMSKTDIFEGALCPGFVNTHCHLELSHLINKLEEKTGLASFVSAIVNNRESTEEEMLSSIREADKAMYENGIVAVGDISNTALSFSVKEDSPLLYHTFIELFSSDPSRAEEILQNGITLLKQCKHSASLTPHANYSVSTVLLEKIRHQNSGEIISIHNQETPSEDEMFLHGTGVLLNGITAKKFFKPTGKTALKSTLPLLPKAPTLMVHNTFTSKEDVLWVKQHYDNVFWATCPKANVYIEDALPSYAFFMDSASKMTFGTDSLASNNTLCILEEMKAIRTIVPLQIAIEWACKNGADFLQINQQFGTFEKGKKPGVNHITHLNHFELTEHSTVRRLI